MLLIKNCKVIPELVEGYEGTKCDILVDDKRIEGIYECGTCNADVDEVVDAAGKTVLPGFFDLHVHLNLSGGDTLIDNAKSANQQCFDALEYAQRSLKAGFTYLRDVGGYYDTIHALRDAVNNEQVVGPTIKSSGKLIIPTENGNEFFMAMYEECDTVDEIKKGVRKIMAGGADFIKVLGTGAVMNPGSEPGMPLYTDEELQAICDMAKLKDTYVSVHCHGTRAIKQCIKCGVRTIEHASMLDDEAIEMLKGNTVSYIVPTLTILVGMLDSMPESSQFMIAKAKNVINKVKEGVTKAYKAGLTIGFGTDTGGCPAVHGNNADEFILRQEYFGMSSLDLLKQATINSAKIIMVEDDYGTIKSGKFADFVIVDGDPLEDISVLKNNIDTVVKWGKVVR